MLCANDSYKGATLVGVFCMEKEEDFMKESLALLIVFGIIFARIFERLKLPALLGMLLAGLLLGPHGLNFLGQDILRLSTDLRLIALIVILLRAGLSIDRDILKRVGPPALRLSFIPGLFEGLAIALISTRVLGFSFVQGGILGFILAAVSPAVVVPSMMGLMEEGLGRDKGIPTMILSGASMDDVFAITIFTSFLALYENQGANIFKELINIPLSIFLGVGLGLIFAYLILKLFNRVKLSKVYKLLIVLAVSILFNGLETLLEDYVALASLLGIMAMGYLISNKDKDLAYDLSQGLNSIWSFAEILLFTLIGALVNIEVAFEYGGIGLFIVVFGLIFRSFGVYISLLGTDLNTREKIFSIVAYLPKATVQAAIGGLPLYLGVEGGEIILSISVLAILLTAPLGSILIKITGERFLKKDMEDGSKIVN